MQEKIIAAAGIFVAVICSAAGWWMENGPSRKGRDTAEADPDESDKNDK